MWVHMACRDKWDFFYRSLQRKQTGIFSERGSMSLMRVCLPYVKDCKHAQIINF